MVSAEPEPDVSAAIRAKHRELLRQLRAIEEEALKLQARRGEIQRHLEDCQAAARLFGVALDGDEPAAAPPPPNGSGNREKLPIRMMVLDELKQAYPNPVRANGLRTLLQEKGINTHQKTVGMTLYRLSLDHLSRRAGIDWFFVPEGADVKGGSHWLAHGGHRRREADKEQGHGE